MLNKFNSLDSDLKFLTNNKTLIDNVYYPISVYSWAYFNENISNILISNVTLAQAGFMMFIVTIIPFGLFLAIMGLELAVSFIQAYVFTILCCSYLKDAIELQ